MTGVFPLLIGALPMLVLALMVAVRPADLRSPRRQG